MWQRSMHASSTDGTATVAALQEYRRRWPQEAEAVGQFLMLLGDVDNPYLRNRVAGHLTGSAWLVDHSGMRVLLTHHRKLGRWLQLGGHADGDRDLAQVALREAQEESGLQGLRVERELFDIDRHSIPQRGDVPGHWHYDARYVVHAGDDERYVVSDESHDLAWRGIAGIAADPNADASLRRMAVKWCLRANLPRG